MTATDTPSPGRPHNTQAPGTITLPADLMHRLLDQLEGETKAKKRQTKADYFDLALLGFSMAFIVVDGFLSMRTPDRP